MRQAASTDDTIPLDHVNYICAKLRMTWKERERERENNVLLAVEKV